MKKNLPDICLFFPIFPLFSPRFFLIFSLFFPIFGKFFAVRGGTLPPLTPSGYATASRVLWSPSPGMSLNTHTHTPPHTHTPTYIHPHKTNNTKQKNKKKPTTTTTKPGVNYKWFGPCRPMLMLWAMSRVYYCDSTRHHNVISHPELLCK